MRALSSTIADGISRAGSPWTQSAGTSPRASRHASPCPASAPGLPPPQVQSHVTLQALENTNSQMEAVGLREGEQDKGATGSGSGCGCAPDASGAPMEPHAVLHDYIKSLDTREYGVVPWKLKRQMLSQAKALAESQAQARALAESQLARTGATGETNGKPDADGEADLTELQSLLLRRRRSTPSMLADRRPRSAQTLRNLVTPLGIADEATLAALFGNGAGSSSGTASVAGQSQSQNRSATSANRRPSTAAAGAGQQQQQPGSQHESALNTSRSSMATNPRSRPGSTRGPLQFNLRPTVSGRVSAASTNANAQRRTSATNTTTNTANPTPLGLRPTSRGLKSSSTTANTTPDPYSYSYSQTDALALLEEHRRIARLRASLNIPLRSNDEDEEEEEEEPPLVFNLPKVAVNDEFGSGSSTSNMRSRSGSGISDAAFSIKSIEVQQQQNKAPLADAKLAETGESEGEQQPSRKFGLSFAVAEFSHKVVDNEGMNISTTANDTPSQAAGGGGGGTGADRRESAATTSSGEANSSAPEKEKEKAKRSFGLAIAMPDISRKVIDNEGMGISTFEEDTLNLDKQRQAIRARIAATNAALASFEGGSGSSAQTPAPGSQMSAAGHRESVSGGAMDGKRRRRRKLKVCECSSVLCPIEHVHVRVLLYL